MIPAAAVSITGAMRTLLGLFILLLSAWRREVCQGRWDSSRNVGIKRSAIGARQRMVVKLFG